VKALGLQREQRACTLTVARTWRACNVMVRPLALALAILLAAAALAAVTLVSPTGSVEIASRGDLYDLLAIFRQAGVETAFARAAGSYTARAGEHEVQFTPGGSLAVVDGRLVALPGPIRTVEGKVLASIETANALLRPFSWQLEAQGERLELLQVSGVEAIVLSQVQAAEGTLLVLRGCRQQPRVSWRGGELTLRFEGPVELAAPIEASGVVVGGGLVGHELTLRLTPGVEVAGSYHLEDPPRFVVRLSAATPAPLEARGEGPVVVLDPGHGGEDWGAAGPGGELEKNIVLGIARLTAAQLQARGVAVRLTREGDETVPLGERTALANRLRATLFLSIHANASPARSARGAETYFMSADATDIQAAQAAAEENASAPPDVVQLILWDLAQVSNLNESARLATTVQERLNTLHDTRDRGVKQAPFVVLTGATMPAALVEVGFLSNPEEAARLTDRRGQEAVAAALAEAVATFLQTRPSPTAPPP